MLDVDNIDRRGERMIKKYIELYHKGGKINRLRAIRMHHKVFRKFTCYIPPKVTIGENLYIAHPFNIGIGKTTVIGDNCKIYPGAYVAAGLARDHELRDMGEGWHATIGNDVLIGAKSTIVGHVTIGDDVTIGAGAMVTKDVPPHTVVKNVNEFRPKREDEIPDKYKN